MQQVVNIAYPLALLPIVARLLSPDNFGLLVFFQSLGTWGAITIIYGLHVTGTRAILLGQDRSAEIAGMIWSSQAVIALALLSTFVLAAPFVNLLSQHPVLLGLAWLSSVLQASVPHWYFRAFQRINTLVAYEVLPKLTSLPILALVLWFEPSPMAAMLVFVTATFITASLSIWTALRALGPIRLSHRGVYRELATGFPVFFSQVAYHVNNVGSIVVLGFFATPAVVGFFGGAERIIRASTGLLGIVPQAIFPVLVALLHVGDDESAKAKRMVITGALSVIVLGLVGGGLLYLLADWLVVVGFGPDYAPAAEILRTMALLPVLYGLVHITGLHGLVAQGLNVSLAVTVGIGAAVNLGLAVLLVPEQGPSGMATAMYAGVATILFLQCSVLIRHRFRGVSPSLNVNS